MANPAPPLTTGEIWRATVAVLRPDFWTLFAVAAPFTLLVDMALGLFGPDQPKTVAEFTPRIVLLLVVLPGFVGAIAQLAVAHMIARPDRSPRTALAIGIAALPSYIGAIFLAAFPTGIGFVLLVVPGLYLTARLFLLVPIAVLERLGPVALVQRSWVMTKDAGWAISLFLVLAIVFLLAASLVAQGVGSALASVLTLLGLKAVGVFVAALAMAMLGAAFSIASAAASTIIYLKLN